MSNIQFAFELAKILGICALTFVVLQFLHESGHWLLARIFRVPVTAFSLGLASGTYAFGQPARRWGNVLARVDLNLGAARSPWHTTLIAAAGSVPLAPLGVWLCISGPTWSLSSIIETRTDALFWHPQDATLYPLFLWLVRALILLNCANLLPFQIGGARSDGRVIVEAW